MTNQEAFNKVWDWFVVQKKPQAASKGQCRYRTRNGRKCAVGVLIPDKMYDAGLESIPIPILLDPRVVFYRSTLAAYFRDVDTGLLRAMQEAHDQSFDRLPEVLESIAGTFDLTIPEENAND